MAGLQAMILMIGIILFGAWFVYLWTSPYAKYYRTDLIMKKNVYSKGSRRKEKY